ncbi:crotonase/enoyl-CoA hydratase family protein [Mesorhizobium amorphae]|uniref:Carnitinyl-CoA dehydratase CaiD n=1 Tax=Mesorhizobium amorphae CCNWGS0123 TaxID=1082933 RepID=G6Y3F8_9HYPH|nr:crotonase/enoyl-CoA hydratase family protein [Mesorhizobium amorphae]ANT54997.1 enoyl-CoA hydratase [Mesorhizobium amorphae CCNWGS0123]EHH13725.1 carnitinyl-CoA dehydratase CaiD [Mesorhizobium amorphae CCNWGS0123]
MGEEARLVLTERRGNILVITINRPEVRNAVDAKTADAIQDAMDLLENEEDLLVGVLTGAGGNFCSGMDLKAAATEGMQPQLRRGSFGIMARPPHKPLIAAVEGYAVAGGFETCLACDMIVAARNAKFGLPEVRHNLMATYGLVRLPARMPYHLAMELALTGELKEASYFERFGVVNRLAEPGQALEEALKLSQSLLPNGPLALMASKEIIFQTFDGQETEDRLLELPIVQRVFGSEDEREGLVAFAEKRKPVWKGR